MTDATTTAIGYFYDSATRDWTKPQVYHARDRMEAIRWIAFNRDWAKNLHIVEGDEGHRELLRIECERPMPYGC